MIRYIFFPTDKKPAIIFMIAKVGNEFKGSPLPKEIEDGRFAFYPEARCQEYSDELWEAVQKWVTDRKESDDLYTRLTKKGLKAIPSNTSSSQP